MKSLSSPYKLSLLLSLFILFSFSVPFSSTQSPKEIHAIANGEKVIESSKSLNGVGSAVVSLTIPKEEDIERIVIHVDAIMGLEKELPSLEVLINQGMSIPLAKNTENIERKSAWFEGNTIVIGKSSSLFCTDCVYTLAVRFPKSSSISIQAQTFKKNTQISGKAELDGVEKEAFNSYDFMGIEGKKEDLVFSVKVHQGKVKIYIDCNAESQPSRDYHWSYIAENSKEMVFTKEDRSRCSTENFSLLVYGEESSVYSLRASYDKSNKLLMGMGRSTPIKGEISQQEQITYEILIPIFAAEEVVLDLHYKQTLDSKIMNCRFATDCPGLLPASRHFEISNFHDFDDHLDIDKITNIKSEEIAPGELRIKISPKESGCYPILVQDKTLIKEPIPVCAYLVTLSSEQSFPVEYTMTAEYKGPNLLSIGEPKFDIVTKNNINCYVLYVSHHEDIESVQIQLTKFSGDVDIFISKSNKYPNSQDPTTKFQFSHEGFILFKGLPDTSEAYYIGIYGLEASTFSLSAIVGTQFGNNEESAWTLSPGKPQKGTLVPKFGYHIQYYKFVLAQENDWTGSLHIKVSPLFGRVLMIVNNNGEFPTGHDHLWKAKGHELEIHSNDFEFKKQALYYVAVISDPTAPNSNLLPDLVYYLTWSLTHKGLKESPVHLFLSPETPFYGAIKKGKSNHFETLLLPGEPVTTLLKQSDSDYIDIFISTDPKNRYPSQDSYTKTTRNSITLEACEAATGCPVYITVSSNEDQKDTSFALVMRKDSSVIALEDGREIESTFPTVKNAPALFYYHAVRSQNSVVSVNCPGREIVIYLKRIKVNTESLEKFEIKPLDEKTAEFTCSSSSNNEGVVSVSVTVPPLTESDLTIVAVSVYFKDAEGSQTTFKILASSQITQLATGSPYSGFLAKDHYAYFMVTVMRPEPTLLISLTIYDENENNDEGNSGFVLSYGQDMRPTISNYQFASISHSKTHVIEINSMDISLGNPMLGNWVLGVYGHTASPFKLTVIYEDRKIVNLQPGGPVEMSLEESSFVYFKFFHETPKNLQINPFTGNIPSQISD